MRTGGNKDSRIALLLEVFRIFHRAAGLNLDALLLDGVDFPVDDFLRQSVLRHAEGHHTAGYRSRFEDGHGIALLNQEIGSGQAGGARTDHGDLFFLGDR